MIDVDVMAAMIAWLHFERPLALVALAGVVVPLLLAVWSRRQGRQQRQLAVGLQCAAIALATLALARPVGSVGSPTPRPYMLLSDVSASTRQQRDRAMPWPADLAVERFDFSSAVGPAGDAGLRDAPRTLLSPALRLAAARANELAGVVIVSDGRWQDDWQNAAEALGQLQLPVAIIPLAAPPDDARIADIRVTGLADGGAAVAVSAAANVPMSRRLVLRREGLAQPLFDREVTLLPEIPASFRITDRPATDRQNVYVAELSPADAFARNDSARAVLLPRMQRTAVLASSGNAAARMFAQALSPPATLLDVADPAVAATDWLDFSAIVLMDPAGDAISPAGRQTLVRYVRGGGGLVLLGSGPRGSPADRNDPLNRISPLSPNPFERKPIALAVVLDASGSMAEPAPGLPGQIKFDLARQAVLSLENHLVAGDSLAVLTYSDTSQSIYDSSGGPIDFARLSTALSAVRPAGPTHVMPALAKAADRQAPPNGEGLVLLLSDLLTEPFDASQVRDVGELFTRHRLKLSVAAIGDAPSGPVAQTALAALIDRQGAQVVRPRSLSDLAEVFQTFLRNTRGDAVRRGRFGLTLAPGVLGRDDRRLPEVEAYILCAAREEADVLAVIGSDPVLARGTAGLGRCVSLAVPLDATTNAALETSPNVRDLIRDAVQWVQRPPGDGRFGVTLTPDGDVLRVEADVRGDDSRPVNGLDLNISFAPVDSLTAASVDVSRPMAMPQVAPGRYVVAVPLPAEAGALAIRDAAGELRWQEPWASGYPAEFRSVGPDERNLHRLADLTGGRLITPDDLNGMVQRMGVQRSAMLWPFALAAAVVLMLVEWCLGHVVRADSSPTRS